MPPKVSVVMPVYNGEKYLGAAIESILSQSFADFEFLVIEDGSTDGTLGVIQTFKDARIKLIRNDGNKGLTRSLNLGLKLADGQYIARMDADDINLRERFSTQVAFLDDHPEVGVLGTAVRFIDDMGNPDVLSYFPLDHEAICWSMSFFQNPIAHPTVMFRRDTALQVNGYDDKLLVSQDYDLWSRLSAITQLNNLHVELLHLRKHKDSISKSNFLRQKDASYQISREHISRIYDIQLPERTISDACDAFWSPELASPDQVFGLAKYTQLLAAHILTNPSTSPLGRINACHDACWRLKSLDQTLLPDFQKRQVRAWITWLEREIALDQKEKHLTLVEEEYNSRFIIKTVRSVRRIIKKLTPGNKNNRAI